MLARGATMPFSTAPENSGSEESAEEEFTLFPLPHQFVPGHLEDLEDALMCLDLQPTYQNVSRVSNGDNSEDSNEKQDSSSDSRGSLSLDDHVNDAYSNEFVKVQEQRMHPDGSHLPNLQIKLEHNYTMSVERSGKAAEVKEEGEEEHKHIKARSQWLAQGVQPAGSTLDGGDPENNERERIFDEEFFVFSPSFDPEQLEDFEDDLVAGHKGSLYTTEVSLPTPAYLLPSSGSIEDY